LNRPVDQTSLLSDGDAPDTRADDFETLWAVSRRGPKPQARDQYMKAVPSKVSAHQIHAAWLDLVTNTEPKYVPHLFRWIRDERWTEHVVHETPQPVAVGSPEWLRQEEERIYGI